MTVWGAAKARRARFQSCSLLTAGTVLSLACARPNPQPWILGLRSFGPIRFGMTIRQASAVLGESIQLDSTGYSEGCAFIAPKAAPPGTAFMVIDTVIVRADIDTTGTSTHAGAHVGSTEDQIRREYPGRIRTEPHPYDGPEWHYLIYSSDLKADSAFGMIFETDGVRVRNFRAGLHPNVDVIEGCS